MVRPVARSLLAVAIAWPAPARRVALVIGNAAYRHVERLANPGLCISLARPPAPL